MQEDPDPGGVKGHDPRILWYAIAAAVVVALDEVAKAYALRTFPDESALQDPGLISFAIHRNFGIAFDIPFKMPVILAGSLLIGGFLVHIAVRNRVRHPDISLMAVIIILGALGNLYDRAVYGFTVDYILISGRLAINLSDIVILFGVAGLLLTSRRTKAHALLHPDEPQYGS